MSSQRDLTASESEPIIIVVVNVVVVVKFVIELVVITIATPIDDDAYEDEDRMI